MSETLWTPVVSFEYSTIYEEFLVFGFNFFWIEDVYKMDSQAFIVHCFSLVITIWWVKMGWVQRGRGYMETQFQPHDIMWNNER